MPTHLASTTRAVYALEYHPVTHNLTITNDETHASYNITVSGSVLSCPNATAYFVAGIVNVGMSMTVCNIQATPPSLPRGKVLFNR
jgi:hypothetical protein